MTAPSCAWWWCGGCARWHGPKHNGFHHSMVPYGPDTPDERNFDGTAEELVRFIACRELRLMDDRAMERRIDERLRLQNLERQGLLPGR